MGSFEIPVVPSCSTVPTYKDWNIEHLSAGNKQNSNHLFRVIIPDLSFFAKFEV